MLGVFVPKFFDATLSKSYEQVHSEAKIKGFTILILLKVLSLELRYCFSVYSNFCLNFFWEYKMWPLTKLNWTKLRQPTWQNFFPTWNFPISFKPKLAIAEFFWKMQRKTWYSIFGLDAMPLSLKNLLLMNYQTYFHNFGPMWEAAWRHAKVDQDTKNGLKIPHVFTPLVAQRQRRWNYVHCGD